MIGSDEIRPIVLEDTLSHLVLAHDIASPPVTISLRDTLLDAAQAMANQEVNALVVVDDIDASKPVGTLGRHEIIQAYSEKLITSDPALA